MIGQWLIANEVPDTARRAFIEAKKPIKSGRVQQKDRVKNLLLYISDYNTKGEVERPPRPPFSNTHTPFTATFNISAASTELTTLLFLIP
jgi:hypothetical protein